MNDYPHFYPYAKGTNGQKCGKYVTPSQIVYQKKLYYTNLYYINLMYNITYTVI